MKLKYCKIGDVVDLQQGLCINKKTEHLLAENGIPLLRITDLINGTKEKFINKELVPSKFIANEEDMIYTRTGQVGLIFKNKCGIIHNNCFKVWSKTKEVKNLYIYWYLRQNKIYEYVNNVAAGAAQPDLNHDAFKSIDFIYPNTDTQDKIVNVLSNYDDLIENNNKRIKILEEMAQKIYKEWFVDFKFPGHETATFKQTELGKIPSDWGVIKANEIADIYIGRTPSRKDFDCFTKNKKDKKWISIKDIGLSNEFIFDTSEYLTDDAIKKYNVPLIPKDTVILSFKLTVGKVAITTEEMTSNEAIAQFQIKNKEEISENYLYLYLKNFEYNNLGNTSSIGNAINSTIVKNMPIIVPKEDIIKEFNKNIISIFSQIKNLTLKIQALKQTRDLLLPRLISGEIDVENLEIM